MNNLKILYTTAEVYPYAGVGGLGQVSYFLTKQLKKDGIDVRIFMPKYGNIDESKYPMEMLYEGLTIPTKNGHDIVCNILKYEDKDDKDIPIVYFLENMEFYEKRSNVYGYMDDDIRFLLLSEGLMEFLKKSEWVPDIINCADWHTGHIPNLLKVNYNNDKKLKHIATVFSIHNLMHQGLFDHRNFNDLDFDNGKEEIADIFDPKLKKQNFVRRGIMYSDVVTTVSEKYSREILTEDYGEGLEHLLREVRTKLFGVLNGIDYEYMNPETDSNITANYSSKNPFRRELNKEDLQKEFNLQINNNPIMGMVTRLDTQKGLDLVVDVIETAIKELDIQFVIIGGGDGKFIEYFSSLEKKYPKKIGTHLMADFILPKKVFSGADMLLLPSKFEPSGITQMEAMRYGCIPIARNVGGLADSITNFDPLTKKGNGFLFTEYDPYALMSAMTRAVENYKNETVWKEIVKTAMETDFSWEHSSLKYIDIYRKAIRLHNNMKISKEESIYQMFTF